VTRYDNTLAESVIGLFKTEVVSSRAGTRLGDLDSVVFRG
jgi:hypothetical protein